MSTRCCSSSPRTAETGRSRKAAQVRFLRDPGRIPRAARHVRRGGAAHPARSRRGRGGAVPRTCPHVIAAVEQGEVDVGVVPIENSIEGSVSVTLDTLAFDTELLDPARDRPAGLAEPVRAARARSSPTSRTVVSHPERRSASAGCGWPRSCPTPTAVRRELHRRGRARGGAVEAARAWPRSATRSARRALRARGARHARSRTTPRTRPASCSSGHGDPRADRPRQDVDRLLPARGPPGLAARDPPGVRGARDQPHQARVAPDEAAASATTASSSTSRATSPTSWSPTACATSRRSRPR